MLIETTGLSKRYLRGAADFAAVDAVDLALERGDFVFLTGRSGSGKSTLLNLLVGLVRADEGRIVFDGKDYLDLYDKELSALRGSRIGYIPQDAGILYEFSVLNNVRLPLALRDKKQKAGDSGIEKSRALLERMGIAHLANENPSRLSGGELQRVAIARSLIADPDLLLADEPTSDLDAETAADVLRLFQEVNQQGVAVIMSTHADIALPAGGRHLFMRDGRITERKEEADKTGKEIV
jgi:putative ABC transport system ATP-binding protein